MSDITVVMPCYTINEEVQKLTEQAIESVGEGPRILIDNASPMGGGYLRSRADIYVRNFQNLGFAKACNQGIKLSQTRYVAIVSTDVRVSPNWREVAREVFKEDVYSCHFRMTNYDVPFQMGNLISYTSRERWCTAAFFVLDKEKDLLFDENFFNSFEDWDLLFRARKAGFITAYTNIASFQHMHSFTQKSLGFPKTNENREYFTKKHGIDPDELLAKEYPEQMKVNYWEGFSI